MKTENFVIDVDVDIRKRSSQILGITLMSQDINNYKFALKIKQDGELLAMDDTYEVEVLSLFTTSKTSRLIKGTIGTDQVEWIFDTSYISKSEVVKNYVYVRKDGELLVSADANCFIFNVDLSEIDKTALKVKEGYDQSYDDLLAKFEKSLNDYKDSLPHASDLRADIDEILNQFEVDSQAQLSQYYEDTQQVIVDTQTAFDLAESVRNEAEESRVQSEEQRASAESSRISAESIRASVEAERVQAEVERKANEESRELAEDERENAEEQRKIDHANRSAELAGKANKKQEDWIRPTLLNGWTQVLPVAYRKDQFGALQIKGMVRDGTLGKPIFILPVGYRPTTFRNLSTPNTSATIATQLSIDAGGGNVVPQLGNNVNVSLDCYVILD